MKKISFNDKNFEDRINQLCDRSAFSSDIDKQVEKILNDIHKNGDSAVIKYAEKFDNVCLAPDKFRITETEIHDAKYEVDSKTIDAIKFAYDNVSKFARQRQPKNWDFSPRQGVNVGERFAPFNRIAAYIPGGNAPLVSTVIHTVTFAQIAGVKEIVIATPPNTSGKVHPGILAAASIAGATEVYRLGGVYGIGAMAYGTQTIQKVEKIVGPGNAFVTAAKRYAYGHVGLDLVAGPSEVLIIADKSANPKFIAADMLAQAEHGSGSEYAILITDSESIIENVAKELNRQSTTLKHKHAINKVLNNGVYLIKTNAIGQSIKIANKVGPEHLEIMTENPRKIASKITAAGAIFLGDWTPEPIGDFVAGPSHVLPTGGTSHMFSGLTIDQFFRKISMVEYDREALKKETPVVAEFATIEDLDAHGRSVEIRFEED